MYNCKQHDCTCAMPTMVKICSCYNLMQVVDCHATDGPPIIGPPGPSVAAADGPPDQAWLP